MEFDIDSFDTKICHINIILVCVGLLVRGSPSLYMKLESTSAVFFKEDHHI